MEEALREISRARALVGENAALLEAEGYAEWMFYNAGIDPRPERVERAAACGERIFHLEPDSGRGHRIAGLVAIQRQEMRRGLHHLRRAVESAPDDTDTCFWLAVACFLTGRTEESRSVSEAMLGRDPLNWMGWMTLGATDLAEGHFEDGIRNTRRVVEIDPENVFGHLLIPMLLVLSGWREEGREGFSAFGARFASHPFAPVAHLYVLALDGDAAGVRAAVTPELSQMMGADLQYSSWMAEIYAIAGERQAAIEWLERAVTRGFTNWPYFARHDRLLDGVRDEPRFHAILERCRAEWERA